jgi:glycosyltransferase involved in cell wall biosynthesis
MYNFRTIYHLIDSLGIGGAQTMMFELYLSINKKYPFIKQNIFLLNKDNIDINFVNSYGIKHTVISNNINKYFSSINSNVVLIYHKLQKSNTSFLVDLQKNFKTVVVNHTYSENPKHNTILGADLVIHVSNSMMNIAKKNVKCKNQIFIHNSVDDIKFNNVKPLVKDDKYFTTGRINTFNTIKYSDDWLFWIKNLNIGKPIIHDYIGGGGLLQQAIGYNLSLSKNINNENKIRLFGPVANFDKKISLIKSWDIFLYEICQSEGVSIAILEALANGIPVICGNQKSNNEIIKNGINGYLFDNKKEREEILKNLVNNKKELDNLKITTKDYFMSNLNINVCVDKYLNSINEILK